MTSPKLYVAGIGMVTPLGSNTAMTVAAVNAAVSAYQQSRYFTGQGEAITMAEVPNELFQDFDAEIDEGEYYNEQYDHVIKMVILALEEACQKHTTDKPVPLVLAMPEIEISETIRHGLLARNLAANCAAWVSQELTRFCHSGRAAGIEAIEKVTSVSTFNINDPLLKRIRHDHLHMSSKDSLGLHPRFNDKGQRWRQPYDG